MDAANTSRLKLQLLIKKWELASKEQRNTLLTIPVGSYPRSFPKGELLCETTLDGKLARTYSFDPNKLLAWVKRMEATT